MPLFPNATARLEQPGLLQCPCSPGTHAISLINNPVTSPVRLMLVSNAGVLPGKWVLVSSGEADLADILPKHISISIGYNSSPVKNDGSYLKNSRGKDCGNYRRCQATVGRDFAVGGQSG
jgi:hypothetical protein